MAGYAGCWRHPEGLAGCEECENEARGKAFGDWLGGLRKWDLMVSLTADPRRRKGTPPGSGTGRLRVPERLSELAGGPVLGRVMPAGSFESHCKYWLKDCQKGLGRDIFGVVALESHRSGWPHAHGLVDVGGLSRGEIALMGQLWFKRLGGNKIEEVREAGAAARYAAKYLSKEVSMSGLVWWPEKGAMR